VFYNLIYGNREFVKRGKFFLGQLANTEELRSSLWLSYVGDAVVDPSRYYYNNVANIMLDDCEFLMIEQVEMKQGFSKLVGRQTE